MVLIRLIVRRGGHKEYAVIMELTFLGDNNELQKCLKQLNKKRVQNFCAPKEIEWNFQPPREPHFGGTWDRLVQCTKKISKSVMQHKIIAKEALRTALVEAEGILKNYYYRVQAVKHLQTPRLCG